MIWPLAKEGENIEGYGADFVQRQEYQNAAKTCYYILQHFKVEKRVPTAPRVPRRSPIQVLTRLNVA